MIKLMLVFLLINFSNRYETRQIPMIATKEANGKEVRLNESDKFMVSLHGNPTTGYTWSISYIDTTLLQQIGTVTFEPESNKMGSPGEQIFHFLCLQSGSAELRFHYIRPWEKDTAPIDSFHVTIVIDK